MHRRIEEFARGRGCWMTYTSYIETPDSPTTSFLKERGFEEVERFYPSRIDLEAFDPSRFSDAIARVERDGFTIRTYAEVGDTPVLVE